MSVGSGANFADAHDVDNTYTWNASGPPYPPDGTAFTDFLVMLDTCVSTDAVAITGGFAGHCDWRLPTIVELQTIQVPGYPCGTTHCIDPMFGPTTAGGYWSSTTDKLDPTSKFEQADISDGTLTFVHIGSDPASFSLYVRAVRGGFVPIHGGFIP